MHQFVYLLSLVYLYYDSTNTINCQYVWVYLVFGLSSLGVICGYKNRPDFHLFARENHGDSVGNLQCWMYQPRFHSLPSVPAVVGTRGNNIGAFALRLGIFLLSRLFIHIITSICTNASLTKQYRSVNKKKTDASFYEIFSNCLSKYSGDFCVNIYIYFAALFL